MITIIYIHIYSADVAVCGKQIRINIEMFMSKSAQMLDSEAV